MRSKRHSTLAGILGAVLLLNLFMVGLLAYTLDTARERKEAEVRTTVEDLALLLDQNVTSSVREIDLTLREIQHHLESELQQRQPLQARQINPRLAEHEQWLQQAPELRITDASGRVRFGHGLTPSTDIDYSDRSFFLAHRGLDDDRTRASHLLMGRISQTWILVFSRRYNHPDGSFAGIVDVSRAFFRLEISLCIRAVTRALISATIFSSRRPVSSRWARFVDPSISMSASPTTRLTMPRTGPVPRISFV